MAMLLHDLATAVRGLGRLGWDLNDAKQIPIRIFEHDEVSVRPVPPWVALRAKLDESFHFFGCLVV
jgi:hypothetical protein